MKHFIALALLTVAVLFNGCASTGDNATTQPSLATITTQAESAFDVAVNAIHVALDAKLIDGTTYWNDIDPIVVAGQSACAIMRKDAAAGDAAGAQAAADAVSAAVAKLQPYVRFPPPTTQKAN